MRTRRTLLTAAAFTPVLAASPLTTHLEVAQDTLTPHPVVGAWKFVNDIGGGEPVISIGLFHADGTYLEEAYAGGPMNFGVWQATGPRTADLTIYNLYVIDDKLVQGEGRLAITVDETGNIMSGPGTFVGLFLDGTIDFAVETQSPGTRLQVLPMVPLGTPVVPVDTAPASPPTS